MSESINLAVESFWIIRSVDLRKEIAFTKSLHFRDDGFKDNGLEEVDKEVLRTICNNKLRGIITLEL